MESEKGLGSTFTVTGPLKRGEVSPAAAPHAEESTLTSSHTGWHVLIAEDNELNAEILTDLLEMEEITSEWAENGKLAVELLDKSEVGRYDAVLMDMRMPVMDGLAAARELRKLERPDAKQVPIIALTANAFEEEVRQCLEAGMDAHLSKPVDIDRLLETIGRLLREKEAQP